MSNMSCMSAKETVRIFLSILIKYFYKGLIRSRLLKFTFTSINFSSSSYIFRGGKEVEKEGNGLHNINPESDREEVIER